MTIIRHDDKYLTIIVTFQSIHTTHPTSFPFGRFGRKKSIVTGSTLEVTGCSEKTLLEFISDYSRSDNYSWSTVGG